MGLDLQLVEPVLDHVADADDADHLAIPEHGQVAEAALGHRLHQVVEAVLGRAGHDLPGHQLADLHLQKLGAVIR